MKILNISLIISLVAIPTIFGVLKMPTEMGLAAVAVSLALCFTNLEKFAEFKGAGFEAKLKTAVDKAYAAIDELKDLALSLSAPIIDELAVSGRMTYIPLKYKLDRVEKIADTLKSLGATDEEIKEASSSIYDRIKREHIRFTLRTLRGCNPPEPPVFKDMDSWDLDDWTLDQLLAFISENNLEKNEEANERIEDLQHFLETQRLRRPDKWQS